MTLQVAKTLQLLMTSKKEEIKRKEERKNRWCEEEGKTKRGKQRNGRKN
jgi:hypothetical protein